MGEKLRFTKAVIEKLLELNEGKTFVTNYSSRNFRETNHYLIQGGKMLVRSVGKGAFGGSQFDEERICDIDTTRRILKKMVDTLNMDI